MNWKIIRLELAHSAGSRNTSAGSRNTSAGRALVIRVPLDENGAVDEAAVRLAPDRATIQRFWESEPDRFGHIEREPRHWAFRWKDRRDSGPYAMPAFATIELGGRVDIHEADGTTRAFHVTSISSFGPPRT